jgi:hypothetical protein
MRRLLLWEKTKDVLASSSVREWSVRSLISFLSNRGVTQIVLGFSLIAGLIAAAVLLSAFSIGRLGTPQGGGGEQKKQEVTLQCYYWQFSFAQPKLPRKESWNGGRCINTGDW